MTLRSIVPLLFMGGTTTKDERTATAASGQIAQDKFNKESDAQKDDTVYAVEELAAMYVTMAGEDSDPRALAVFAAGQKAGRIDTAGTYIGPHRQLTGDVDQGGVESNLPPGTQRARDPAGADNSCGGPNSCGGLTQLSARRQKEEGVTDAQLAQLLKEISTED